MTQEPTHPHFTDGRRRTPDVIQQLHEIGDLVAEVTTTAAAGAPNPGSRTGHTRRPRPDSKPPTDLDALDALAPDRLGHGIQWELSQAVRAVYEDQPHLPLVHEPTIAADCAWLITHAHVWQPDPFLCDWVTSTVDQCWRQLQGLVRTSPEPRLICARPGCGERARFQPGGTYLRCEAGHENDVNAERGRYLQMQDWTLAETFHALREHANMPVPMNTLKTWAKREEILPIDDSRPRRYNFGAVLRHVRLRTAGPRNDSNVS